MVDYLKAGNTLDKPILSSDKMQVSSYVDMYNWPCHKIITHDKL